MIPTCKLCKTATAQVVKFEDEIEYNEDGTETAIQTAYLICKVCADYYYDGTEDYVETYPLAA